jgi:YHS domain-containing protein
MNKTIRLAVLIPMFLVACTAEVPDTASAGINATPAMNEKLAAADAVDGTVDNVVHRCAGCSLGMDGKADMALKVGGYEMHFCKPACQDRFEKAPEKEILALRVPK